MRFTKNAIWLIILCVGLTTTTYASEVTGTLSTGLGNSSVEGVVITTPSASPVAGTYSSTQNVTLSASGSSSIRYTIDGTTPTCSTGTVYTSTISISSTKTIKTIACYPNSTSSSVATFTYTISTGGSGGGGSSGSGVVITSTPSPTPTPTQSISPTPTPTIYSGIVTGSPQEKLAALLQQLQVMQNRLVAMQTGSASIGSPTTIPSINLSIGSVGNEVKNLQIFLNQQGFLVSQSGVGSVGNETTYFGPATKAALMKFQAANGVVSTGYFGPLTRNAMKNMDTKVTDNISITPTPTPIIQTTVFTRHLGIGSTGDDVRALQQILADHDPEVYPEKIVSGYYGSLTKKAVERYQEINNIAGPQDPGYGTVGPKTREFLNNL